MTKLSLRGALEHLETVDIPAEQSDVVPMKRKKIRKSIADALLPHAEEIRAMNEKTDQIAAYNHVFEESTWESGHKRLSSIADEKLRKDAWKALPNTQFKRFQLAFSDPEDYIVPSFTMEGGKPYFHKEISTDSVKACLVDPDRIPDQLLEDLQLVDFDQDESEFDRIKKKYEAIPKLKLLWESTLTLPPRMGGFKKPRKNLRMLRVERPSAEVASLYPDVEHPKEEILGTLLYSRGLESGDFSTTEKPTSRLVVSFYDSAYPALRKTMYEAEQYEEEIRPIMSLKNSIKALNARLNHEWKPGASEALKAELLAEAGAVVAQASDLLQSPQHPYKKRAADQIMTIVQQLEQKRIGASMSKMVGTLNALDMRLTDILPKSGFNEEDRMTLSQEIFNSEDWLKKHRAQITTHAASIDDNVLYGDELPEEARLAKIEEVIRRFDISRPMEESMKLRPFIEYVQVMKEQAGALREAMARRDKNEAKTSAVIAHVIGKLFGAIVCVERLKNIASFPKTASLATIKRYAAVIEEQFAARDVFPDEEPLHIAAMYEPLETSIHGLRQIIEESGPEIESDPEAFLKYCSHLRDYLDSFEIEQLVQDLRTKARLHNEM